MAVQTTIDLTKLLPASFTAPGLTEAQFVKLCEGFPDAVVEYTAEGEVLIVPPTDFETGKRVAEIIRQLGNWAIQQGEGEVGSPEAGFFSPTVPGDHLMLAGATRVDGRQPSKLTKSSRFLLPTS